MSREQGGTPLRCVGPLLRETLHVLKRFTLKRILLDYSLGKRDQSKIDRPGKIGPQRRGYRYPTTSDGNRRVYKIQVKEIKLHSSHTNFALHCTSSCDCVGNGTLGAKRLMAEVNSHPHESNQMIRTS